MKAVGYIRVSTEEQARQGVSLEAQEARIRAWSEVNEAELVALCADEGVSGHLLANRPGLQQALDDACREKSALVVYSLSRLARNTREALEIADRLDRCGADLVSLSEKIDTTSAAGKMVFRLLAVLNEFERDLISERTRNAMQYAKSKGQCIGHAPYGYDEIDGKLVLNEKEQEAIELMTELRSQGLSLQKIAESLAKRKIKSKMGGRWHPKVIRDILRSSERWQETNSR